MHYLTIVCILVVSLLGLLVQNGWALVLLLVNLVLSGSLLGYYSVISPLLTSNDFFFSNIDNIAIFSFAAQIPLQEAVVTAIIIAWLLGSGYLSLVYTYYEIYNCYRISNHNLISNGNTSSYLLIPRFTVFFMGLSIFFMITASNTLQLIMAWIVTSAVFYYSIYNQGCDASEINLTTNTSIFLLFSDVLFIIGIITLTYNYFAHDTRIIDFITWDLIWLMNPIGSLCIILAVMLKSPILTFHHLVKQMLFKQVNLLAFVPYALYSNLIGSIILLHFDNYLLQSDYVCQFAILILFLDLITNFIRCLLDINLNRIILYFCLAHFNYTWIVFFAKNSDFFLPLFLVQFLLSCGSICLTFWLTVLTESDDIRVVNFNNTYKLQTMMLISLAFLPHLLSFLFNQYDINQILFFSHSSLIPVNLILSVYMILSVMVFLRVFLLMSFYKNQQELIFSVDAYRIFNLQLLFALIFLILTFAQTFLFEMPIPAIITEYSLAFKILYLIMFSIIGFILMNLIRDHLDFYSNLHRQYIPWINILSPAVYLELIVDIVLSLWQMMRFCMIKLHQVLDQHFHILSSIFYLVDLLNHGFITLQRVSMLKKYLAVLIVIIFLGLWII